MGGSITEGVGTTARPGEEAIKIGVKVDPRPSLVPPGESEAARIIPVVVVEVVAIVVVLSGELHPSTPYDTPYSGRLRGALEDAPAVPPVAVIVLGTLGLAGPVAPVEPSVPLPCTGWE